METQTKKQSQKVIQAESQIAPSKVTKAKEIETVKPNPVNLANQTQQQEQVQKIAIVPAEPLLGKRKAVKQSEPVVEVQDVTANTKATKQKKIKTNQNIEKKVVQQPIIKEKKAASVSVEKLTKEVIKPSENTDTVAQTAKQSQKSKISQRFEQKDLSTLQVKRSIIYVGRLPYAFEEIELREFFGQYGEIVNLQLSRSRKSNRSKGYAFIQFLYPEIAQIAADSMNGYMIHGKVLDCHVLESNQENPFSFKLGKQQFKFINWQKLAQIRLNQDKNADQLKGTVQNLLQNEQKKRKLFAQKGINYSFPGFSSIVAND